MNRRDFERLVVRAIDRIPKQYLDQVKNLVFRVEDWADEEILAEVGSDDPRELLGFYSGWPLAERPHDYGNCLPDEIILYHLAIEDYVDETGEPLMKVIRETLLHELAHYFGFSEAEMDEIEALWMAGDDREAGAS